jgi:hypothetical protein
MLVARAPTAVRAVRRVGREQIEGKIYTEGSIGT